MSDTELMILQAHCRYPAQIRCWVDWLDVRKRLRLWHRILTWNRWNEKLFPDHVEFLKQLHKRNLKVTLNTHPADGVRSYEKPYEKMCEAVGRDASKGHVSSVLDVSILEAC